MVDDIEHLKKHKIVAPAGERRERVSLPTVSVPGVPTPPPPPLEDEAFGGSGKPVASVDQETVRARIIDVLKTIHDPEIPVNIYELGLIYGFEVDGEGRAEIEMTLTAPACPVAGMLVREVADKVGEVDGVSTSHVKLVWEPPWSPDRMSEEAKLELGFF